MNKMICFCHNYTEIDLMDDVNQHGRSTIMERIIVQSKASNCNRENNNPKGH